MWDDFEFYIGITYGYELDQVKQFYYLLESLYENSKDFKVTWKLKPKIDRRLHKNRPLALAIGRWLDEQGTEIRLDKYTDFTAVSASGKYFFLCNFKNGEQLSMLTSMILPDDYIIPEKVLQWMKEYREQ